MELRPEVENGIIGGEKKTICLVRNIYFEIQTIPYIWATVGVAAQKVIIFHFFEKVKFNGQIAR